MRDAFVVSSLSLRQGVVSLHSDQNQVGRGSHYASDEPSRNWANTFLGKIQFTSFGLFPVVEHFIVNSESGSCVKYLTSQSGIKTMVKAFNSSIFY